MTNPIRHGLVSTPAPRAGSDLPPISAEGLPSEFQLTLPEWGATSVGKRAETLRRVQHTLPERGATGKVVKGGRIVAFQLTLPERGATFYDRVVVG